MANDAESAAVLNIYQRFRGLAIKYINEIIRYSGMEISPNVRKYLSEKYNISSAQQDMIIRQIIFHPDIDTKETYLGSYTFTYRGDNAKR